MISSSNQPSSQIPDILPIWKQRANGTHYLESPFVQNSNNKANIIPSASEIQENNDKANEKINDIIDFSERIKKDIIVNTEWGPGRIKSVDKENKTCLIAIESDELSFPIMSVNPSLNIYACIIDKLKTHWMLMKVNFSDTALSIKQKIGKLYQVHHSQIVLIHSGYVVTDNKSVFDMSLFEKDDILVVIKDKKEFSFKRFKSVKIITQSSGFNSVSLKVSDNIILTGLGFYKSTNSDTHYELIIKDTDNNVMLSIQNILVKKMEKDVDTNNIDNVTVKYKIGEEIIFYKDKIYEIQQNLNMFSRPGESNFLSQCVGYQSQDGYNSKNGLKITFLDSKLKDNDIGKENMSSPSTGKIPIIYYTFKI